MNQEALSREFAYQQIPFKEQPTIQIAYKGELLEKTYQPDSICYDGIIVEIKGLSTLSTLEEAQLVNYLKAINLNIGLLINFGSESLGYKRMIYT